ncbi:hypothetical protein J6TS1_27800 [Siminovitchia terrae]|uniref:Uncharacterized protein n=1 Tax=Siminovitchia terrae TaxID=1914933 RepID=A0ABQ4KXZ5_SIMTE|nr:hypothetical protein [Siminovitchia terrae]GIN90402.1 hypothetical protein J22TS1_14530 [Siminovitchia terrae]GIN96910.1 hypothetical protein J6TS1_27800 [Siminovitchia terrae]
MPYKAYRDINKTLEIRACDTTIEDTKKTFYCSTKDCKALMTLVNGGDSERAHFRRRSSSPKHSSIFCSADGNFASTEYDESQFNFDDISTKLIDPPSKPKRKVGKGTATLTGGGGKKSISTVHQIYCMCRKYDTYNNYLSNDILADERNFARYRNGIVGNKIVQCTPYHKFKDEFAYKMNYPSFPYPNGKHIRLNFSTEKLFWEYYHKFKDTNHKDLIIVLGNWTSSQSNGEYIAECTINSSGQIHFLKNENSIL